MGHINVPQVTVEQYLEDKENFLPRTCNPTNTESYKYWISVSGPRSELIQRRQWKLIY
jgi:hypothetical protein